VIAPRDQWCAEIDVTSACHRRCSNCLRLSVAHRPTPWHMRVDAYERAVVALKGFVAQPPDRKGRRRHVGMIGGEPLMHPGFTELCAVLARHIPFEARAIFTGVKLNSHPFGSLVYETFSYVNENLHDRPTYHQPILAAPVDLVPDPRERQQLIDACVLQEEWSSTITPKGFFFCEVAGSFDALFGGPGGLEPKPGCWDLPLEAYREQIDRWCHRCGVCLPLPGRLDREGVDDVSVSNLEALVALDSPRIARNKFALAAPEQLRDRAGWVPFAYLRSKP
jgi:hypothetical protein